MRMFDFDPRLLITGAICVSYILYQVSSYLLVALVIGVGASFLYSALSAHTQRHSGLSLGLTHHARPFRRRNVSGGTNKQKNTFTASPLENECSAEVTPTSLWGVTKAGPVIRHRSVRVSPIINRTHVSACQNASTAHNIHSTSSGFASQVVSTAFQKPPLHHPRYSGLGVFPTVHLQKHSLPLLSPRNSTMVHNPVTVRISPLEKYKTPPSPKVDYLFDSKVQRTTPPVESVISALQSYSRKRSFRNATEETQIDGQSKRQRRDSSSSVASAFTPTSTGGNILNGMLRSTTNILLQQHQSLSPGGLSSGSAEKSGNMISPSQKRTYSSTISPKSALSVITKKCRNNEISSSYSSSSRSRLQAVKRRRLHRPESPSIKISKLHHTISEVFATSAERTVANRKIGKSMINAVHTTPTSPKITTPTHQKPQPVLDSGNSSQGEEFDMLYSQTKLPPTTKLWRDDYSRKRQLSLYSALTVQAEKTNSVYTPHCTTSLEDDHRDQLTNQARLNKIMAGVNQAFHAKDAKLNLHQHLDSKKPLIDAIVTTIQSSLPPVSLAMGTPIFSTLNTIPSTSGNSLFTTTSSSQASGSSAGLLSIASVPPQTLPTTSTLSTSTASQPTINSLFGSGTTVSTPTTPLTIVDTTTTTTSTLLTVVSSTSVGKQEVQKLHEQNMVGFPLSPSGSINPLLSSSSVMPTTSVSIPALNPSSSSTGGFFFGGSNDAAKSLVTSASTSVSYLTSTATTAAPTTFTMSSSLSGPNTLASNSDKRVSSFSVAAPLPTFSFPPYTSSNVAASSLPPVFSSTESNLAVHSRTVSSSLSFSHSPAVTSTSTNLPSFPMVSTPSTNPMSSSLFQFGTSSSGLAPSTGGDMKLPPSFTSAVSQTNSSTVALTGLKSPPLFQTQPSSQMTFGTPTTTNATVKSFPLPPARLFQFGADNGISSGHPLSQAPTTKPNSITTGGFQFSLAPKLGGSTEKSSFTFGQTASTAGSMPSLFGGQLAANPSTGSTAFGGTAPPSFSSTPAFNFQATTQPSVINGPSSTSGGGFQFSLGANSTSATAAASTTPFVFGSNASSPFSAPSAGSTPAAVTGGFNFGAEANSGASSRRAIQARRRNPRQH